MPIRVLLVEDSRIALVILRRILTSSPNIEIVGEACTGVEALALIPKVQPDVICTDLHMPQMDGLTLTSEVIKLYPRPILVISASVRRTDTWRVFQLLEAGAVDICPKPISSSAADNAAFKQELLSKIEILAGVKVLRKRHKTPVTINAPASSYGSVAAANGALRPGIVVIGASTGGPQALCDVFVQLPADFPVPILCVQHICLGFLQGLIDWLSSRCVLPIQIAQPGDIPQPGRIYFAPERYHLELDTKGRFICSNAPRLEGHRPAVTTTFKSVASVYGQRALGILLTGMGRDGADGLLAIAQAGGFTIAQDEATSVIFGMPKEAIKLGAAKQILPIRAIAPTLLHLFQCKEEQLENRLG
jgi:two-component system, chemotaxis family, protein-glutamate methylesterase/glutaminase